MRSVVPFRYRRCEWSDVLCEAAGDSDGIRSFSCRTCYRVGEAATWHTALVNCRVDWPGSGSGSRIAVSDVLQIRRCHTVLSVVYRSESCVCRAYSPRSDDEDAM